MPMTIAPALPAPRRGRLHNVFWRMRQFGHALRSRPDPAVDRELQRLLGSDAQWQLLDCLTPFDRAHHLRVYTWLVESGENDPDLLRAALLHDVGKADERGRVNAFHRAIHVLLKRIAPALLERLAVNDGWFRHGLWLSVFHAEHGASLARAAGASERCCSLIASHAAPSNDSDPLLMALAAADNASIR
jgi:hypothetical protein